MSNSIGDLRNSGLQGNNFPWQLKMLMGQQCACDALTEIADNTDTLEPLLAQILAAIQNGTDYEAALVVDNAGVTWLEVRIWNGTTFDPPIYFAAGSNTPGTPVAPITYVNPNSYLAQIVSNTSNLISIEAGTPDALGQTTMSASMPVTIASDQTPLPVNATIVGPTGTAPCVDSFPVTLCTDQANVSIRPVILREIGSVSSIPVNCFSVSFSSVGTADALISFDAGLNFVSVPAGTTINMDASGVNNFYASGQFFWDTVTNAGSELLITYNT